MQGLAEKFGIPQEASDRFDEAAKGENDEEAVKAKEAEKASEQAGRDFEPTPEDDLLNLKPGKTEEAPKTEPKEEGQTPKETPSIPEGIRKRFEGKSPDEIMKSFYEAEVWGKTIAHEANFLKQKVEEMDNEIKALKNPPAPSIKEKYGEAGDVLSEIVKEELKPIYEREEAQRIEAENRRRLEFQAYNDAYRAQNKDYAENGEAITNIATNMVGMMVEYMKASGCNAKQIQAAVEQFNYDKRIPYVAHTILKGENLANYAKSEAERLRTRQVEAQNAKAEFGGGAAISGDQVSSPKFNNIEEELEWRRKNDPSWKALTAFSQ